MARLQEKRYDIVLVNIVADVIIALAPVLPALLDESSALILSGILDVRLSDVLTALKEAGLSVLEIHEKEDWRCIAAKKE
jgi:ribosomal protein L11 methyltransferase